MYSQSVEEHQEDDSICIIQGDSQFRRIHAKNGESFCETVYQTDIGYVDSDRESIQRALQHITDQQMKYVYLQNSFNFKYIIECFSMDAALKSVRVMQEYYLGTLKGFDYKDLSYSLKLMIIQSIAQAIQIISKEKISHNCINPSSICICEISKKRVIAKLNNFRFAFKMADKEVTQKKQDGKKNRQREFKYLAPQLRKKCIMPVCGSSDLWSLGVVFYELVFGQLIDGEGIEISESSVKIRFPEETPSWLINIFEGMLAYKPEKRFSLSHICSLLQSALVCEEATQKILKGLKPYKTGSSRSI